MTIGKSVNSPSEESSPIRFRLDASSGVPTYFQIVTQVEHALRIGYLRVGDQLPRIKDAVEQLAVNPNTVLKAYRELEQRGIVEGRPGVGTFVIEAPTSPDPKLVETLRQSFISDWLESARNAGLSDGEILSLVRDAVGSFTSEEVRVRP
jgi:GntR family transcriptional regulator